MGDSIKYNLNNYYTGEILYEGYFLSIKHCVEFAINDGVCLDGVDLSYKNLSQGNFDTAQMAGAIFRGSNLSGANLSETVLDNADFLNCDLTMTCLSVSSLMDVNFTGASFGQTDVTDAIIRQCRFSCPTIFSCLLQRAATFSDCMFFDDRFGVIKMNELPVRITGLPHDIVCMDDVVKIGHDYISKMDLASAGMKYLGFLYGSKVADYLYPMIKSVKSKNPTKNALQYASTAL